MHWSYIFLALTHPLLMHWSSAFLALTHRYIIHVFLDHYTLQCVLLSGSEWQPVDLAMIHPWLSHNRCHQVNHLPWPASHLQCLMQIFMTAQASWPQHQKVFDHWRWLDHKNFPANVVYLIKVLIYCQIVNQCWWMSFQTHDFTNDLCIM